MWWYTVEIIKFWDCVYEIIPVVVACESLCGWKYVGKLRQLRTVFAQVLWEHTQRSSREVCQENADEQSGWGGVGFTGMQNYGVKTCFRCVLFVCPEGSEGTGAILVKSVYAEK